MKLIMPTTPTTCTTRNISSPGSVQDRAPSQPAWASPPFRETLAERILDAFPSGSYALSALLRLMDIVETTSIATAAVECEVQPRMLINPEFVYRHAATPEKLLMLVMHELHHVLLGHTTLFPRATPSQNFVFDAVINGLICRMFPEPEYTAFFTDFYSADAFPECLLRPPPGWSPTATVSHGTPESQGVGARSESCSMAGGIRALPESRRTRVAEIHAALYCAAGASYDEVFEALPALLTGAPGQESASLVEGVPLIGGHGDNDAEGGAGQLERHSPLLFDIVRGIVEQWPQPPDPIRGRSLNDVLQTVQVKPQRSSSNRAILRSLIRKVAGQGGEGTVRRMEMDSAVTSSPIPGLDRRSMVLRLLGQSPLLHNSDTPWKRSLPSGERVHVYLDVSGSMESLIKALYGAVLDCEGWVFPLVHLFSTKVADVSLTELRQGICQTTGGTDIACVARHMATHRVRRALLITDGWVGIPRGQNLDTLKRVRLAVAFAGVNLNTKDLGTAADHTAVLEPPGASTNPRSSQKPNFT